jgi:ATPase subunit of ABC transporter with duplicated ATPase domains
MQLALAHVSFAHADAVPLLIDQTHIFEAGWSALVGGNGAGKTTLLRILAGDLRPDRGTIRILPAGVRVRLCPQEVRELAADVRAFAGATDRHAARLRGLLGLDAGGLARWPTLSPGERKRWQVGAALACDPTVLLLDEPTNHLDATARDLLLAALRRFEGIGVVVSHDRGVLNALATRTLRLERGVLRAWSGGYDAARGLWESEARRHHDAYQAVRRQERTLERRLADRRERRDQAASRMRTSRQMKNLHDSDARLQGKRTRGRSAEAALAREIRRVGNALARTRTEAEQFHFHRSVGRDVPIVHAQAPVPDVLRVDEAVLTVGNRALLRDVHLTLGREDRVRVFGPNGAGKSTLLRALLAGGRVPRERVLYLPQELAREDEEALLATLRALPPAERGHTLALLAGLGVEPSRVLASARPSPGEARKVCLALGLARQVWAAVLDEPTNHLDLPSIERLEETLAAYPGALLIVTHDDALARRVTSTRWAIADGWIAVQAENRGE